MPHAWTITFTAVDGETLHDVELGIDDVVGAVEGHTHGLNRDPVIESLGEGSFDVSELNLSWTVNGH